MCTECALCAHFLFTYMTKDKPSKDQEHCSFCKVLLFCKGQTNKTKFWWDIPKMALKNKRQNKTLWQCCCYHSQKKRSSSEVFFFSSVIPRLQRCLTLNCSHGHCSTVLCLWFPCRWCGPIIMVAAMTACAALWAKAADISWPAGRSAIPILFALWKQITRFPWPVIGWQVGYVRCCSTCSVCLKSAATRRGPAGLCRGTTLLGGFNLCLVSDTAWKRRAKVAAFVARRSGLVEHRCFCSFGWRGTWCTCVLSLNSRHKGSMKSFTQRSSLWGRSGWGSWCGLTQRRGWSGSSDCAQSFFTVPLFCWQSGRKEITFGIRLNNANQVKFKCAQWKICVFQKRYLLNEGNWYWNQIKQ